jgi:hypothetical protein
VGGSECAETDLAEIRNAPSREKNAELMLRLAAHALAGPNFAQAEKHFSELGGLAPGPQATYFRIYTLCLSGKFQEAGKLWKTIPGRLFKSPAGAHFLR